MHDTIFSPRNLLFAATALVVITLWGNTYQRKAIKGWASSNGYRLLEAKKRYFRLGPFSWVNRPGATFGIKLYVWYVKVITHDSVAHKSQIRHAWILLSAKRLANYSFDVSWDD